ncbi:MAG: type II toxin-antitoxin system RelE/ParE family toxin [Candidatus Firestonebacteria bacterium]|nr:type II toxin-antitoxin system RelE/ParE family toxin [Candidatus Firestonebacteria bacterium]
MTYKVVLAPAAFRMLKEISDRRVRDLLIKSIDELTIEPEKKGKALLGPLKGFRSLRSAGQRYRIIYQIRNNLVEVLVVAVGIRKEGNKNDIYNLVKKFIQHKLL